MMRAGVAQYFKNRTRFKDLVRQWYLDRDFVEVETPILVASPGCETHQDYFSTQWMPVVQKQSEFYLRSSPELHMKRLMATDIDKMFQLAWSFRNGADYTAWHHPEFLMLEWYEKAESLDVLMTRTEDFIRTIYTEMSQQSSYQEALGKFECLTVYDAFEEFADLKLVDLDPDLGIRCRERHKNISINAGDDFETCFFKIMLDIVEPQLKKLGFCGLYDYPPSQAILSQVIDGRAKRFETYINGIELSNGFLEELDSKANRDRFHLVNQQRSAIEKPAIPLDDQFFLQLDKVKDSWVGNALGLDRLFAIIMQEKDMASTLPFRSDFER